MSLRDEIKQLQAQLEQVTRERDNLLKLMGDGAGDRYKHYKGGLYSRICVAYDEAIGPDMDCAAMVYVDDNGTRWYRRLTDFESTVDGKPRFRPIRRKG